MGQRLHVCKGIIMTRLEEAENLLRCVLSECDIRASHYNRALSIEHFLGEHKDEPDKDCEDCIPSSQPPPRAAPMPARTSISFAAITAAEAQHPEKTLDQILEDLYGKR